MDTQESKELISVFSSFMFNRKYKIHCADNNYTPQSKNVVSLKDYKFYNKRLLNFYKTLLLNNQSRTINDETLLYINKIPNDLIELGNKFIEESILFFKREDTNEIIQQELIKKDDIPNEDNDEQTNHTELLENTNDIDMKYYFSKNNSSLSGTFRVIEEENENSKVIGNSLPQQRQYHLRDNSFRLKGITKNNNMSILYEQDEQENSQVK
jgi:hypothetical protein